MRTRREPSLSCVRWYVGRGLDAEFLCIPCANAREQGTQISADGVCDACFKFAVEEACDIDGIRGKPEVKVRDDAIETSLSRSSLPGSIGKVRSIAPINGTKALWLILTDDGALHRFDAETFNYTSVYKAVPVLDAGKSFDGHSAGSRLHVSHSGAFAAVVDDYGQHGRLIDLEAGRVTVILDGGTYHPQTVPFSFAFAEADGRTIALHRTSWNRLDITDPATGRLLSARGPTGYRQGEKRPEHYLDYFHGGLYVSPTSQNVLDDGWVWHPVGVPTIWSLPRWLNTNVWESEDGPTRAQLCWRTYYWNRAICWIDDERVAVGGIGDDDEAMVDGARLFKVAAQKGQKAEEFAAIVGPAGTFFSDGHFLFSCDRISLSRWSIRDGVRTGHIQGFRPTMHHRGSNELVELDGRELVRWRIS